MPTPEERLVVLLNEKQQVEARFKEANDIIDACKQKHAEILGGVKILEAIIAEAEQEEVASCEVGTAD